MTMQFHIVRQECFVSLKAGEEGAPAKPEKLQTHPRRCMCPQHEEAFLNQLV